MSEHPIELSSDPSRAVEVLRNGGLVAIPTETVYGLAGDVEHPEAIERIFTTKNRPPGHPLIIHVSDLSVAEQWADLSSPIAQELAHACWPGPLTLLAPRSSRAAHCHRRPTNSWNTYSGPLSHPSPPRGTWRSDRGSISESIRSNQPDNSATCH